MHEEEQLQRQELPLPEVRGDPVEEVVDKEHVDFVDVSPRSRFSQFLKAVMITTLLSTQSPLPANNT